MSRLVFIMLLTSVALPWTTASEQPRRFQASAQEPDWHQALDSDAPIGFFIAPDDGEDSAASAGDAQLARWALAAWETAAEGRFELVPAARERSLIQLYWVSGAESLYGDSTFPQHRYAQRLL